MGSGSAFVEETRWRGAPALRLVAGPTSFAVLPGLGLTGVSLRRGRAEFLATPGGPARLRDGHTLGLPLLAPWANRLEPSGYRAAGVRVRLDGLALHRDADGLPMHGLLVGATGWRVTRTAVRDGRPQLDAAIEVGGPAFPFPHRLEVRFALADGRLAVTTTIVPTTRRAVPVAFGWHPYLRVPGAPRSRWRLRLPAREHLALDPRGLPTGLRDREPPELAPIGRRTFDDLYALGRDRVLAFEHDAASVVVRLGAGYGCAQVWVPPGQPFGALEPMTVPTNALASGATPLVAAGDAFRARYSLEVATSAPGPG